MEETKLPNRKNAVPHPSSSHSTGKVLQLPGGLEYYHEVQQLDADAEGINLLDLRARQDSVPLFSTKIKSMIRFF